MREDLHGSLILMLLLPGSITSPAAVCYHLCVTTCVLPVCFEVVFEMSRPRERPAAALERAAEDLLGEGAAGPRRLVPVCCQAVCVVT